LLKAERHRLILELLQQEGNLLVSGVCEAFGVSEMTVRRDLRELEQQGLLRRVHGGAIDDLGRSYEPVFRLRETKNIQTKQRIGRHAAQMIISGDSVAIDTGTTTLEIVRSLASVRNLTIVTSSLPIATELAARCKLESDVRLILTGGIVRNSEHSMVGEIAQRTYGDLHVDKAFVGIGGIHLETGLTEYSLEEALVKRVLLESAQHRILVADGSKFNRVAFASVCSLSCIDTIVTDESASVEMIASLRRMGIEVVVVDAGGKPVQ
jgi:DeoR/GlpR family transcriptional regulator of sugar metabolism